MAIFNEDPITCTTSSTEPAIKSVSNNHTPQAGPGVMGISDAVGVWGESNTWHGLAGLSRSTTGGHGVFGKNLSGGTGVVGESDGWMGVYGRSASTTGGAGVMGEGDPAPGVIGKSTKWIGVYGETAGLENGPAGVWGEHKGAGVGVKAISNTGVGLVAFSNGKAAILDGHVDVTGGITVNGVRGESPAGFFHGDIVVTGDVKLAGADLAEQFSVGGGQVEIIPPGSVVVAAGPDHVCLSDRPYDRRVLGVVSGAGTHRPGLILDHQGQEGRLPLALTGKVWCLVDADQEPVAIGDLLTTSATPGHAMKAGAAAEAFGAVLGKALDNMPAGRGLLPILIALQ